MAEQANIEALYHRLVSERRKVVETAAESAALPPARFLGYLADLDGAIVALEAVLEDRTSLQGAVHILDGQEISGAFV